MTKIFEGSHYILIQAGYSDPAEHRHMAAHIIVAMDGDLTLYSGSRTISGQGVVIPSGINHRVDTHGNSALVFLFDCMSGTAREITDIRVLSDIVCRRILAWYGGLTEDKLEDPAELERELFRYLDMSVNCTVKDDRIISAMDYIRGMYTEKVTCGDVADHIHLSQDRFSHLFRQETGMSFPGYVIYQRLMRVYVDVFHGKSITEAAFCAGFSGSSHLADVNRRVFGISIRSIMENATFRKIS